MTAVLLAAAGIAAAAPLALLLWANRTLVAVDVVGHSMEPAFHHGDRVLVRRVPAKRLRVGDVAVLGRPDTGDLRDLALIMGSVPPWVVKRVAGLPGDRVPASVPARGGTVPPGHLVVLGDNTGHSTDSRVWGPIPDGRVLGVVLRRMTSPRTPAA